jgi:Apea-like HEPN
MKEASSKAIKIAFEAELARLRKIEKLPEESHWEYHRGAGSTWNGKLVSKISFMELFAHREVDSSVADVEAALQKDYPEHLKVIGTFMSAGVLQSQGIPLRLAVDGYKRFGTFALTGEQIEAILADVSRFFERTTVRMTLYAPALNISGPPETPPITFPGGFTMRPITDEEFNQFYGGNPIFQTRQRPMGFPEFVFAKEIEIPKVIGSYDHMSEGMRNDPIAKSQEGLDLCILALATFKDAGPVGYDGIWIIPSELTLGSAFGTQHRFGNDHVPFGRYDLAPEEAPKIEVHAEAFDGIHSTLEMASQRLVDSARRTKPRDTIVDAVIGLETILLANTGDRTELRFRFSLHYALLFAKADRKAAFLTARDLYDLRSTIAHGSKSKAEVTINGKTMTLVDAATLARSVLRKTIDIFIPNPTIPDFMKAEFWTPKELGID